MTTFEEQFPSLNNHLNCCIIPETNTVEVDVLAEPGDVLISSKELLLNCLDKQKVREAIEKYKSMPSFESTYSVDYEALLKELNL